MRSGKRCADSVFGAVVSSIPRLGTGYFIGAMPKDLAEVSEITAIEIDRLSSRILSRLYGQHGVRT
jgi:hypothetical protein